MNYWGGVVFLSGQRPNVFFSWCDFGQEKSAANVFFYLVGWCCTSVVFPSTQLGRGVSLIGENTERFIFVRIPFLWLSWGLTNAIKLPRPNRLSNSAELSVHLFLSQGKWQAIQIIPDSLHWQLCTKINYFLFPTGCKHAPLPHS